MHEHTDVNPNIALSVCLYNGKILDVLWIIIWIQELFQCVCLLAVLQKSI